MTSLVNSIVMKYFLVICFSLVIISCNSSGKNDTASSIETEESEAFFILAQNSDHYSNGFDHGSQLIAEVNTQLKAWESAMSSHLKLDRDSLKAIVFKHSGMYAAVENHAPKLLEEIHGIADGAGVDWKLLMAFNLGEEIYNFCNRPIESCSSIGIHTEAANTLAYNQDLPEFLHGDNTPVILKHLDHFVFTLPGMISLSGISKAMAVSCNSLPMLKMDPDGLPLTFAIRKLLEYNTIDEAKYFLKSTNLAIPQNITLTSSEGIIGFEVSKNEVREYGQDDSLVLHTNFPLVNFDLKNSGFKSPVCRRYNYLDSISQSSENWISETSKEDLVLKWTEIFNQEPVLNQETYLRFVVAFNKSKPNQPLITFINPKKNNAEITFKF